MAAKTEMPKKRVPLSDVDWQIFRLGTFAFVALVFIMAAGWLFGERGAQSHVDAKPATTSQARH